MEVALATGPLLAALGEASFLVLSELMRQPGMTELPATLAGG